MMKKDKELLLKDLSARLLYKIICHIEIHHKFTGYVEKGDLSLNSISIKDAKCDFITCWGIDIDYVRPYLRPMSSMTEEEKNDLISLFGLCQAIEPGIGSTPWYNVPETKIELVEFPFSKVCKLIDWLNAHHFDYRGLIEKGLALEAPEGMYNLNKE